MAEYHDEIIDNLITENEVLKAEIDRLRALLGHAAKNLTTREAENDEMNEDIIRLLPEVGQLRDHVKGLLLA
ncbi:MAG: hypothetical protein EHM43_12540, partial [Ignavibacteriae bacterium]